MRPTLDGMVTLPNQEPQLQAILPSEPVINPHSQLMEAIEQNDLDRVDSLLGANAINLDAWQWQGDRNLKTFLGRAIELDHVSIVVSLLAKGANCNFRDGFGCPPLYYLNPTDLGMQIAQHLTRYPLDLMWQHHITKDQIFHYFASDPDYELLINFLLNWSQNRVQVRERDQIRANLSLVNAFGETPFHKAITLGHTRIAQSFMRWDPSVIHDWDDSGTSPLGLAARAHNRVLIRELLELGLDLNHANHSGNTVLHELYQWQVKKGLLSEDLFIRVPLALVLRRAGAVCIENDAGELPSHFVIESGESVSLQEKVAVGAPIASDLAFLLLINAMGVVAGASTLRLAYAIQGEFGDAFFDSFFAIGLSALVLSAVFFDKLAYTCLYETQTVLPPTASGTLSSRLWQSCISSMRAPQAESPDAPGEVELIDLEAPRDPSVSP